MISKGIINGRNPAWCYNLLVFTLGDLPALNNMPELILVLDKDAIAQKVSNAAKRISKDYQGADLMLVCVLKGAFVFMADLIRQIALDTFAIDFVRLCSYGDRTESSGRIRMLLDLESDIAGKDVLIVEDILDTGLTMDYLINQLQARQPRSVKTCVMIDKLERRQSKARPDYVCHTVEQGFLVGYGLDYAGAYRNLPEIYHLEI
jgi:hypoxanthine phosphoribosyltransferase